MAEAVPNLPIVTLHGTQYYVYTAKKNESLYGIARQFNWDDNILGRINSNLVSPLSKGTRVYYPVGDKNSEIAESPTKSIMTVDDKEPEEEALPLTHLIKRGETVYSISHMYNIPVETIYRLNPGSREKIKAGDLLRLQDAVTSASRKKDTGDNPAFYTIKKGDTLYQLARRYNTTVAAILAKNPGISETNFRVGAAIKLPMPGEGVNIVERIDTTPKVVGFEQYKASKEDTWNSIAAKSGVAVEDVRNANSDVHNLKKNTIISVPVMVQDTITHRIVEIDNREESRRGLTQIYKEVHGIDTVSVSRPEIRVALLMSEPSSKRDLDFMRGMLTGIHQQKNSPYNINFKAVDGSAPDSIVINDLAEFGPRIIFSTNDKGVPDYISDFALVSNTPTVNVFDLKDDGYASNPYIIQLLTPSSYFNEEIAYALKKRTGAEKLVIAGPSDPNDQLATELASLWNKGNVAYATDVETLSAMDFSGINTYLIYGIGTRKQDITNLMQTVRNLREENPGADIVLIGRPNWAIYDESLKTQFHETDVTIPARFFYDRNSSEAKAFQLNYNYLYQMQPLKAYPVYAVLGFDAANYFISGLYSAGGDINALKPSSNGVQSDFSLTRPANWSGMLNPTVYLVRFTPYETIEKTRIDGSH